MTDISAPSAVDRIVARIERLPTSWWQVKARIIVGTATFFDAFDALAIASVLPVVAPLWKLTQPQTGFLISAGFLGQLVGALLFGWLAERHGRMTAMIWSIALFSVMSLVCAFAFDYWSLLVLRAIQGIGLGGEVPVPTPTGTVMMRVPKHSNTGATLRLRGKGVRRHGGGHGDELVKLTVMLPPVPDAELEKFAAGWEAGRSYDPRRGMQP